MKRLNGAIGLFVTVGALAVTAPCAFGRVKLITLPVRERVEIQLDHAAATLVEEQRTVPLVKGLNQVDFSWTGTSIDPGTIVFRVLGPAAGDPIEVNVLSVSYPPGENALVWQVSASDSGSARVRISYLLGRLGKSFNYRAVAAHDETTLSLRQYIRVRNFAGEAFADTHIHVGFGGRFTKPIGLNETKEMLVERFDAVPVRKTYTCDPAAFGYLDEPQNKLRVPMHYVLTNNDAHGLGRAPLPDGKVRLFQQDSRGATAFIGEDWGQFTPIDDRMKLYLGVAQDIVVRRTIDRIHRQKVVGNLSHYHIDLKYEIENFKDRPVTLDLVEQIAHVRREVGRGHNRPVEWVISPDGTTFDAGPDPDESSQERIAMRAELPARDGDRAVKTVHRLRLVFRNEW